MIKFSIIIPVYNVEKYIEQCLLSCINQVGISKDEYEIIVVNDGTKDNSMDIVRAMRKRTITISDGVITADIEEGGAIYEI
jgi:glycosyltransferase involved in cell wall biosynthesis